MMRKFGNAAILANIQQENNCGSFNLNIGYNVPDTFGL